MTSQQRIELTIRAAQISSDILQLLKTQDLTVARLIVNQAAVGIEKVEEAISLMERTPGVNDETAE